MKIRFTITEPLAQHLAALASTEGLILEEFAQRTILTSLLRLELPRANAERVREAARMTAQPLLSFLDRKRSDFLDKKNREEMKRRQESQLREQEARNRESAAKIQQMVDGMTLEDVKGLLSAIKTKIGA